MKHYLACVQLETDIYAQFWSVFDRRAVLSWIYFNGRPILAKQWQRGGTPAVPIPETLVPAMPCHCHNPCCAENGPLK